MKAVKTIIFSELPKNEKLKYFQFLIENDINFSKDEEGNYIALIKVLNPQFYNDDVLAQKDKIINQRENNNQNKPHNAVKKNYSSSMTKINENVKHQEEITLNKQVTSEVKIQPVNKSSSVTKQGKPTRVSSSISNNPNTIQYLKTKFNQFISLLNPIIGVRPRKMNIYQLRYNMEEMYSIKFMMDTVNIKNKLNSDEEKMTQPFSNFIIDYKTEKHIKKPLIDQNILDILVSVDYYSDKNKEVQNFLKFLTGEYDSDDLIFFLFVRTCIEKEMKIMFMEKAREEMKLQYYEGKENVDTELYLNLKSCLKSK